MSADTKTSGTDEEEGGTEGTSAPVNSVKGVAENPRPLGAGNAMSRRKADDHRYRIDEFIDPISAVILGIGALMAFPIAKKVAPLIQEIVDGIRKMTPKSRDVAELERKIKLARAMAEKAGDFEKKKLLDLVKTLESELKRKMR
jgi:hypothetical protein